MKEKNVMIKEIRKKVPSIIEVLRKTYNFLMTLDSLENDFVVEFYQIFPKMKKYLSIPKSNKVLIQEEIED